MSAIEPVQPPDTSLDGAPSPKPRRGGGLKIVLLIGLALVIFVVATLVLGGGGDDDGKPTYVVFSAYQARQVKSLYIQNCASCHGTRGQGLPHQGTPLRGSEFIQRHNDQQLIKFITEGRPANHPDSQLGIAMPPKGGNNNLSESELRDLVGYLRFLQTPEGANELR